MCRLKKANLGKDFDIGGDQFRKATIFCLIDETKASCWRR